MPSAKTHTALSRQWELLRQLPKRAPGSTVTELLARLTDAGYVISRRSIERDLHDLSLVFPLQRNEGGTPSGWYWKPGVSVELQGITLTEAVSLALVEDAVRPLLPGSMLSVLEPRFEHARQKLKGLGDGNPAARWPDKVASVRPDFNMQAPQVHAETLEALQHALISEQQIRCQYYSAHNDKQSDLTLNPLAIVQRGLITYLIATAAPYTDVRQFAVHRFREVTVLDSPCQGLESFELHSYLATDALQFGKPEKICLEAWVSERQARLIRETPLSTDMTLEPWEQGFRLQATVNNTWQLHWWLLSLGDAVVVHAPAQLRQQIGDTLRRAAAAYAPEQCLA
ncbi:TPA: WYL domain-containing protein [Pseudomonas putida]|uniref:helix-turn-helix transcriptional regulator n=1 Tax=unclassified Pseudomonas TaxID=196821 RepID=UPI0003008117|nr:MULTISPECIES: WYL domain-containing protein [Pseudomonas]APE99243.1 WYL domain-containing protein [Pseudomonas putida]MBP0708785.1 WYL domain-containing protein [Pseudomonas sp. T34]MCE1001009.1 WYL domain-containing protein [Pseudomonas sp. NMI1173_11]MCK2188223.1 WYL domain-containing protein [Pseudomonas sp. MB04B]MDD2083838.1 WYL domain-containing protein [Pseudomonas putida]